MSYNDQSGCRRSTRLAQDPHSNNDKHLLIDLNDNPTPSPSPVQSKTTSNSYDRFTMNLLSFSANDYEIQSTSNSSNDAGHPFNDNIINYSTNGLSDSHRSVSNTSIAPPNILEAPINTSNISELQQMVQALRTELSTLHNQPNSTLQSNNMLNSPMSPMTANNNTSTPHDVPTLRNNNNYSQ
jgi:hypothetical protein